ncbi:alpha-amylase [Microdochium nivale]|nr:alpha-amylase [Microdochium nivale]
MPDQEEEENFCLLQGFEWNVPADGKHWRRLRAALDGMKAFGIDNLWLPPACKAAGGDKANGYDIYDLYDLGEFDQKGSTATKWGSKAELLDLSRDAKDKGISLYFDAVLNHKAGADEKEKCRVQEVDQSDRTKDVNGPQEIEAWLGFNFPGRGDKYSTQKYHWEHFSGTDYDAGNDRTAIFRILGDGKYWSASVGDEGGNADFLMFADVDFSHPEVEKDVINWGHWVVKELGLKGFRFDACQHFSARFTAEFMASLDKEFGKGALFNVGEYWSADAGEMLKYLDDMDHRYSLFDSPMVYNFSRISQGEKADLRKVFDGSLVQARPASAVTVVMNHDTQPGQTVATPIEGWFKPLAYSLILLRNQGYPSIFYGDLYGIKGEHEEPPACGGQLADMALARKLYAYGDQNDYWDDANCIGFARRGTAAHPNGLVCVMSNAEPGQIRAAVGEMHSGEVWTDVLGWQTDEVHIGEDGYAVFPCPGTSVSIWVNRDAPGRDRFGKFNSDIYAMA